MLTKSFWPPGPSTSGEFSKNILSVAFSGTSKVLVSRKWQRSLVENRVRTVKISCCVTFRALLFGGLRESKQECAEVELKETNATAFHHLLKYIYTGKINLVDLKVRKMLFCFRKVPHVLYESTH